MMPGSVDQPPADRPPAELVAVGELELAEHRADVGLDRLHRDAEAQANLLVEVAAGYVAEDLPLAGGELVEVRVDLLGRQVAGERIEHEAGEAGREDGIAVANPAHGVRELLARDRLGDVAPGSRADDRDHVAGIVGNGECEEALLRPELRDLLDHLDAAPARHVHVEQYDLRPELRDRPHGVLDRLGLAEGLDSSLELGLDARAEDRVVVHDHDGGCGAHRPPALMLSSTSVPSPGSLRISARPPCRFMRPIIDSRTPRRSFGIASGSKPGPRSSTNTRALPSSISA